MEMYAQYVRERLGREIIYNDKCFLVYTINGDELYVVEIFVRSEFRKTGAMKDLINQVEAIAKEKKCKHITGTIYTDTLGATESLVYCISHGMKVHGTKEEDCIVLIKKVGV